MDLTALDLDNFTLDETGEHVIEARRVEGGVELSIWKVEQRPGSGITVILTPLAAQFLGVDLSTLGREAQSLVEVEA